MAALAPLSAPEGDAWLSPFVRPGRSWWLLREEAEEALSNAIAELVSGAGERPGTSWVALLGGSRERLSYIAAAAGMPGERRVGDRQPRMVLGPLSTTNAVAVLDRAETASVTALLILVDALHVPRLVEALGRLQDTDRSDGVHMVLMRHAGECWAAVGLPSGRRPDVPGVAVAGSPQQLPTPTRVAKRAGALSRRRGAILLAAGAAAILVGGGSWLALGGHTGPVSTPARGAVPSASGAATAPEPANQPSLAFDSRHQEVALFGGIEPAATWLWANRRWASVTPSISPSDRFGAAMAWNPVLERVMLFGGREPSGTVVNDTWAWDGSTWARLDLGPATPRPPGWEFSGMAWDVAHQQMVLLTPPNVGYAGGTGVTWTWSGGGWDRRASAVAPPAEPSTAMAFDPATQTVLLVLSGLSPGASPSTWSWDGTTWRELHPLHQPDLGGFTTFLAPVPGTRQLILTRVSVDPPQGLETWTWDGHDWTRQHPSVMPTGIVGLVVDASGGEVIALGRGSRTQPLDLAWAWTGAEWAPLRPVSGA